MFNKTTKTFSGKLAQIVCAIVLTVSASTALAGDWFLKSSNKSGWDVKTEGTYSSSKKCSKARKEYLKNNPDRLAVCLQKN